MTKAKHIKIDKILPPDVIADIGTVLSSGLPTEAVAKNVKALLKFQEDRLVKEGLTAGMLAELLLKQKDT